MDYRNRTDEWRARMSDMLDAFFMSQEQPDAAECAKPKLRLIQGGLGGNEQSDSPYDTEDLEHE